MRKKLTGIIVCVIAMFVCISLVSALDYGPSTINLGDVEFNHYAHQDVYVTDNLESAGGDNCSTCHHKPDDEKKCKDSCHKKDKLDKIFHKTCQGTCHKKIDKEKNKCKYCHKKK